MILSSCESLNSGHDDFSSIESPELSYVYYVDHWGILTLRESHLSFHISSEVKWVSISTNPHFLHLHIPARLLRCSSSQIFINLINTSLAPLRVDLVQSKTTQLLISWKAFGKSHYKSEEIIVAPGCSDYWAKFSDRRPLVHPTPNLY